MLRRALTSAATDAPIARPNNNPTRHTRNAFDSLAFCRELQAAGLPRAQAEVVASNVLDVLAAVDDVNQRTFASKEQITQCKNDLHTGLENQRNTTLR
ncbi:hypothetical protein AB1Y20_023156 [Prymnesium parvum]|uniref:Uncharacterized protein n=1 Tax=Prymnesium parvum TaxID=97485 RepID=A0AB34JCB8_PRYPA